MAGLEQHYIPRFYLKRFSLKDSEGHFRLYRIEQRIFVPEASIREQAREKGFYGFEGLDELLGHIETQAAPILAAAIEDRTLPKRGTRDYEYLLYFVASLKGRTKAAAHFLSAFIGEGILEIMKLDERMKSHVDGLWVGLKVPQKDSTVAALRAAKDTKDLSMKLLLNSTTTSFITSDSPVVSYNQFAEFRKINFGATGFAWKGLQMFLPLGPGVMLVCYDARTYKVGNMKQTSIEVSLADVHALNRLQLAGSEMMVYGSDDLTKERLELELYAVEHLRRRKRFEFEVHETEDPLRFVHAQKGRDLRVQLDLSFIRLTDRAKREPLQPFDMQLRDETIRTRGRS